MPVPVHFYRMVLHFMVIPSQSMCLLICHGRSLLYRYCKGQFRRCDFCLRLLRATSIRHDALPFTHAQFSLTAYTRRTDVMGPIYMTQSDMLVAHDSRK